MEMGGLWWSLPADDGEVFGPILSDPLDWPFFSTAKPTEPEGRLYSTYENDGTMDIQYLLHDPLDEQDLDECLGGPLNPSDYSCYTNLTPEVEGVIYSPTRDDGITVQALRDPKINLLDSIPKGDWRRGRRGPRKRTKFWLNSNKYLGQKNNSHWTPGEVSDLVEGVSRVGVGRWTELKNDLFSKSVRTAVSLKKSNKYLGRKNNSHWTYEEVSDLVEGVSRFGVGRWTELKNDLFSKSVRTSVNLKDKWRNLLEACGVGSNSKNKGRAPKTRIQPLDRTLIKLIQKLAIENPYPRPKE